MSRTRIPASGWKATARPLEHGPNDQDDHHHRDHEQYEVDDPDEGHLHLLHRRTARSTVEARQDLLVHAPLDLLRELIGTTLGPRGLQRRKLGRPLGQRQLEDAFVLHVLEPRVAEVAHLDALGEIVSEQHASRLREQDLTAVARGADPGRPDDVHADVAFLADGRLAGVQAHAYLHVDAFGPLVRRQGALSVDCSANGFLGPRERVEEGVALSVDLLSAGSLELLAQDPAVIPMDVAVAVAESFEQPRRALDVREEKGDGAAGELAHRALA